MTFLKQQQKIIQIGIFLLGLLLFLLLVLFFQNYFVRLPQEILSYTSKDLRDYLEMQPKAVYQKNSRKQCLLSYAISDEFDDEKSAELVEILTEFGSPINFRCSEGETPLSLAIKQKKIKTFQALVGAGADLTFPTDDEQTPLMIASKLQDQSFLTFLRQIRQVGYSPALGSVFELVATCNVEKLQELLAIRKDLSLNHLLLCASGFNKDTDIVQELVRMGADINYQDTLGRSPITYAALYNKNPKVLFGLIQLGARVNEVDHNGNYPLHQAILSQSPTEVIQALLLAGANPNLRNLEGISPFELAKKENHRTATTLFMEISENNYSYHQCGYIAHLASQGTIPQIKEFLYCNPQTDLRLFLFAAVARQKDIEVIKYLCKNYPLKLNMKDFLGRTPICYAITQGQSKNFIQELVQLGASLHTIDDEGNNLLMLEAKNHTDSETIDYLLQAGISGNITNFESETALMIYLKNHDSPEIVTQLCAVSRDSINMVSTSNKTALAEAIEKKYDKTILDILREYGADLTINFQNAEQLLFLAIRKQVPHYTILWLLDQGADVNEKWNHTTPLLYAIAKKELSICSLLLERGADANYLPQEGEGETALLMAIHSENEDLVQLLLSYQADPNLAANNISPLQLAFTLQNYPIGLLLLRAGADPNIQFASGKPLLIVMAENNLVEGIKDLLSVGADPDIRDSRGQSAWDIAKKLKFTQLQELLEDVYHSGYKNNSGGIFANLDYLPVSELNSRLNQGYLGSLDSLLCAISASHTSSSQIEFLIDQGANINAKNALGWSPFMYALKFNSQNDDLLLYMLKKGADVNLKNREQESILIQAINVNCSAKVLSAILKNNQFINENNADGRTPIQIALQQDLDLEKIQLLFNAGALINKKDALERNALVYAVQYSSSPEIVDFLLQNDFNIQNEVNLSDYAKELKNISLLTIAACTNPNPKITQLLLKKGFSISFKGNNQRSIFSYAAQFCDSPTIISLLLQEGADVNQADSSGRTPLMYAAGFNHNVEILKIILEAGADTQKRDNQGCNALYYVISESQGSLEKLRTLSGFYNLNQIHLNDTPLSLAVKKNPNFIDVLLSLGADPCIRIPNQEPILYTAIRKKIDEKLILDILAQEVLETKTLNFLTTSFLLLKYQYYSNPIWHFFIESNRTYLERFPKMTNQFLFKSLQFPDAYNVTIELLNIGISPSSLNSKGESALMVAIKNKAQIATRELLSAGADPNYVSPDGITPLQYALQQTNLELLSLLLSKNANPNLRMLDNRSPLEFAIRHHNEAAVLLLLKNGANINTMSTQRDEIQKLLLQNNMSSAWQKIKEIKETGYQTNQFPQPLKGILTQPISQQLAWLEQNSFTLTQEQLLTWLLHEIVHNPSQELLAKLLGLLENKNITDFFDCSPLFYAIKFDVSPEIIHFLLKYFNLENKNSHGLTLIQQLVEHESKDLLQKALAYGSEVNTTDKQGNNLLQNAINKERSPDLIHFLIKQGVDIDHMNSAGDTALSLALKQQNFDIINLLIKNNASKTIKFAKGNSLMHLAVATLSDDLVCLLVDLKVPFDDINDDGETPLFVATDLNNDPIVTSLLIAGADPTITTQENETVLTRAIADQTSLDVVLTLLAGGANVNPPPPIHSPLILVLTQKSHYEYFEALLQSGVNPMGGAQAKEIPILIAAEKSPVEMVKRLTQVGADITIKNSQGQNVLEIAREHNKLPTIQFLETLHALNYVVEDFSLSEVIAKGTPVEIKAKIAQTEFIPYNTLLICAILNHQSEEILKTLIDLGADIHTQSLKHETVLHLAIKMRCPNTFISYLLEQQLNPNAIDDAGNSPLYYAVLNSDKTTIEHLIRFGADINHKNKNGKTLQETAREVYAPIEIISILTP